MMTFKAFLSEEPLKDLQIDLFFRKELGMPKNAAEEARMWVTGHKDWEDLEYDARDYVLDYVNYHIRNLYDRASWAIKAAADDHIRKAMYHKYGIKL